MIFTIARQNLFHDKVRLLVTLTGVTFAVVLITVQTGLFLGFTSTISGIIDHSEADVWVASKGVKNFDIALPMHERKLYQVLSVPGVRTAKKLIVQFADWQKPDGGQESVEIVGYDVNSGLGGPWNIVLGVPDHLSTDDSIIVDTLYMAKLGIKDMGQRVEINRRRARVVGLTHGIRSFTTSPYVFTSLANVYNYARINPDQLTYILASTDPGVAPATLRDSIRQQVADVDVFTTGEFSEKTREYWMTSTGAGAALLIAAALGLLVGMVVVAQTLYATTMDHLPEFATLKAMGAPNTYIYKIIMLQAVISACIGYGFGMGISAAAVALSNYGEALILLPGKLVFAMFFLTQFMCVTASYISIHKVTRIDPVVVFKGR